MFQKVLEQILAGCPYTINFIDDIIIAGKTEQEHDEALNLVLERLKQNGILLNQSKCAFKMSEIDFLGHRFNENGMAASPSKVDAIRSFRPPTTGEEVRSFLGLVNYVGSFIPDLATVSFPLRELTKQNVAFRWSAQEQKAFEHIIAEMTRIESLSHFDPKLKTRVVADASPVGLGAVLLQVFEGQPRVVCYASKSLTDTERRYAQTEKEALALVWSVERFQIYLLGIRFELETDHKPLEAIFSPNSSPCLRIERWVLRLQAFSYDVVYRKGKANIADPLSRLSRPSETEMFDAESEVYIKHVTELAAVDICEMEEASKGDPELSALRECLNQGIWNYTAEAIKPYHAFRTELGTVGELIVRGSKLIVPLSLRKRMLQLGHEGHPGKTKMQQRLRNSCWWPGMDDAIGRVVDACEGCRLVSHPERPEPMQRRKLPEAPWVDVAIDFLGPLPTGDYLLVIIDYFSRYKEVEVLRRITAQETAERLDRIFVRLGYPKTITLDNGRQFISREFEEFCNHRGIVLNRTTPYWPQENGLVERQNRSLMKRLKISQALSKDWRKDLNDYLTMYYSTPHCTTGKTPSELMMGRTIRTKLPSLNELSVSAPITDYRDKDQLAKDKGKMLEDQRRRAKVSTLEIGDKVLMKNVLPGNKLAPTFGPNTMTVTEKHGSRVTVRNDETLKRYDRNASHLKKIVTPDEGEGMQSEPIEKDNLQRNDALESAVQCPGTPVSDQPVPAEEKTLERALERNRPQRSIRKPLRFEDCVLDY